jgi:hypothetical protein
MSDSFGRRPPATREALRSDQAAPDSVAADGNGPVDGNSRLRKPLIGLLAGFGIVGFLFATHVAAMKGFGRALDRHWSENVGYPDIEDAFKRTGSADKLLERVHNDCKSRSDFVGRNPPQIPADVMSADDIILGQASTYLTCIASEQPARFCQAPHRTHLFAVVKDYFRLKGKVREEQVMANAAPFGITRNMMMGPSRETIPTTSAMMLASDPRVIAALRTLVTGGYVSRRDLLGSTGGWPSDLDLALRDVEPKRKGCG